MEELEKNWIDRDRLLVFEMDGKVNLVCCWSDRDRRFDLEMDGKWN